MMSIRYSSFPLHSHPPLYHTFQNCIQSIWHEIRFVALVYILSNLVSEFHEDKRDQKFAHEPAMQTDKSINQPNQSTESVVRTIPTVSTYHISEPIMSENSPKTLSFRLFGEVFHSAFREHCATVRHTARFWRLFHSVPCNSFVHFFPPPPPFFPFYFLSNKSNFRCVLTKTFAPENNYSTRA